MKWIEMNGLSVLEQGAHQLVPSAIPGAALRMDVVGAQKEDSPHCPSARSQSSLIPS
jgi:hypothetical protein